MQNSFSQIEVKNNSGPTHVGNNNFQDGQHVHYYYAPVPLAREPFSTSNFRRDAHFVGREELLETVHNLLHQHGYAALTGGGGIGKSQIAIEYCWRFREKNPHFIILWVHADSISSFDKNYRELATKLLLALFKQSRDTDMEEINTLLTELQGLPNRLDSEGLILLQGALGAALMCMGRYDEADRALREAIEKSTNRFGPKYFGTQCCRGVKAMLQFQPAVSGAQTMRNLRVVERELRTVWEEVRTVWEELHTRDPSSNEVGFGFWHQTLSDMSSSLGKTVAIIAMHGQDDVDWETWSQVQTASLEEAKALLQAYVERHDTERFPADYTMTEVRWIHHILLEQRDRRGAADYLIERALISTSTISRGGQLNNLQDVELHDIYTHQEVTHPALISILKANIKQQREQSLSSDMISRQCRSLWDTMNRLQARQLVADVIERFQRHDRIVVSKAFCDSCNQTITGIRHKCCVCPDYDICSRCLGNEKNLQLELCSRGPSIKEGSLRHCWMPIFGPDSNLIPELIPQAPFYFEPDDPKTYSFLADPNRDPSFVMRQHWHMQLSLDKGWESEPDESKRIRSRFASHYHRRQSTESSGLLKQRRSRSTSDTNRKWQPPRFEDLVPAFLEDPDIWADLIQDDMEERRSRLLPESFRIVPT